MKHTVKRFFLIILCTILVFSTIYVDTKIVYADEDETYAEPVQEMPLDSHVDPFEEPFIDPVYPQISIAPSATMISFGHIQQGTEYIDYQGVSVTNTSNISVSLDYQLCDAEDIFILSVPDSLYLAPGESAQFYVSMKATKATGYYSANLIVVPSNEISATVNIGFSGEIVARQPYITYMSVVPSDIELIKGSTYQFKADVRGENNPRLDVSWSVDGNNSSNTTIDNTGVLRIDPNETSDTIYVWITSLQDTECTDFGVVHLKEGNYNVTTKANPANGGTTGGGGSVVGSSDVEVFAAPNNGYRFVNWTDNGNVVSNSPKFVVNNVKKNYDLVANFEQVNCYVKINSNHPEGGTVTNSTNVSYNGSLDITAEPKSGFRFVGWYENGNRISTDKKLTIKNIVTNREFTANFEQDIYNVNVQVNPQDTGAVTGTGSYKKGSNALVTARAYDGYEFDCWTVNNSLVSQDANYTIKNIDKDISIVANFKKKNAKIFKIKADVSLGKGDITPNGSADVPQGADVTYTFAPAKGYAINAVVVDGVNVGALPSYTFRNVNDNHSISVLYTLIPETVVHENKSTKPTNEYIPDADKKSDMPVVIDNVVTDEVTPVASIDNDTEYRPDNITDENVSDMLELTELTGVLQKLNMPEEEARLLIKNNEDMQLLEEASLEQYLSVSVHNEYALNPFETESNSFQYIQSTPNFQEVVSSLLDEDEKIELLKGSPVWINFNLVSNNKLQSDDDKMMVNMAMSDGLEIGNFFEVMLIKTKPGYSQMVTELSVPMTIELSIPNNLRAQGRKFYIIRSHADSNGNVQLDYLQNISTDDSKIVFTTDKFSDYAIAYKGGKSQGLTQAKVLRIFLVAFSAALIITFILIVYIIRKLHRHRRHRRGHVKR